MKRGRIPPHPRLAVDYAFNALQGRNELEHVNIGLSLSGGGYRATLFAAGAVAALADGLLWPRVRWTASVSGGSFANALAALTLSSAPDRADVDEYLRQVVARTTRSAALVGPPSPTRAIRGPALVARSYQAAIDRRWLRPTGSHRQIRLADLQRDDRLHAFLAVDLASLAPVFLSDRLVHSIGLSGEDHVAHEPGELSLAAVLRASASFPLLPAVRVREEDLGFGHFPMIEDMYLGDGGVWNNLATNWERQMSWLRRDLFSIPEVVPHTVDLHIVVDSSAPARRPLRFRTSCWPLALDRPVLAIDRSLHAAFQSTLQASRQALRPGDGDLPARVLHVAMAEIPSDLQVLSVLVGGADAADWRKVSDHNKAIGTILPTLRGVTHESAVHLVAHGYGQAAAGLTTRGVPFERFTVPHKRVLDAIGATGGLT